MYKQFATLPNDRLLLVYRDVEPIGDCCFCGLLPIHLLDHSGPSIRLTNGKQEQYAAVYMHSSRRTTLKY